MRPKSIATVVVVLFGVAELSSTSALASVIMASVVSGSISESAPTIVVFPEPNPPATTILADEVGPVTCGAYPSESNSPKPTEHPLHELDTRPVAHGLAAGVPQHHPEARHVTNQHAHHAERQPQQRG